MPGILGAYVAPKGGLFGTGSDGTVTFDGSTTVLGLVPASQVYTMTRDIQCTGITINNGVTLKPAGFRIFCQGSVTNNGTISAAGNAAVGSTAGAAQPFGGVLQGSGAGGAGGTGVSGAGANGGAVSFGAAGGAGGAGTSGAAGNGGTVNATTYTNLANDIFVTPIPLLQGSAFWNASNRGLSVGAGGGGGGSDASSNAGGGGGGGGGMVAILAWAVNNSGGTITVAGGNGAAGAAGNAGGGGGGTGGLIAVYTLSAWTAGTTTVSGGALGAGVGTGSNGSAGGAGNVLNVVIT